MNPIQLLVIDVDGTLVDSDLVVRPRVRQSLEAARERGVHVALCTGRPERSTLHYVEELNLRGYHIFDSGATIVDSLNHSILFQAGLEPAVALEIIRYARERQIYLEAYTGDGYFIAFRSSHSDYHAALQKWTPAVADLAELAQRQSIRKLEIVVLDDAEAARARQLVDHFAGQVDCSWAIVPNATPRFVNILRPGISKGDAITRLRGHLNVSREQTMGVGDGPNDDTLLMNVGVPIAMGDAADSLKQLATWVTSTIREDGLALAVERYILNHDLSHNGA